METTSNRGLLHIPTEVEIGYNYKDLHAYEKFMKRRAA